MGFFDFLKRWSHRDEEEFYSNEEIDLKDVRLDAVDFSKLDSVERAQYVTEQCEIIQECNQNIESAKREYKQVTAYFSDVQLIEAADPTVRENITYLAKSMDELSVDRKILVSDEAKISSTRYLQIQQEEETMVDTIKALKNDELYLQMVKRDISALNGEKKSLTMDQEELVTRQNIVKNISIVTLCCFAIIFFLIIYAGEKTETDYTLFFYLVMLLATIFAVADVVIYQRTVYNMRLTDVKMARAISLLNKVKIKYINTRNLLDYRYDKYGISNSYELADLYQRYLETKAQKVKYRNTTRELSETESRLLQELYSLNLYDPHLWMGQIKALGNPKEMVEVRHSYTERRQALRKLIEENTLRAESAKSSLRDIIDEFPRLAPEVLEIVNHYDDPE